jgi:hypothetical protein
VVGNERREKITSQLRQSGRWSAACAIHSLSAYSNKVAGSSCKAKAASHSRLSSLKWEERFRESGGGITKSPRLGRTSVASALVWVDAGTHHLATRDVLLCGASGARSRRG